MAGLLYTDFLVRSNERYNLQLIDITGRQVATQLVIANGLNTLDISALNAGIYSYRLVGNSGLYGRPRFSTVASE